MTAPTASSERSNGEPIARSLFSPVHNNGDEDNQVSSRDTPHSCVPATSEAVRTLPGPAPLRTREDAGKTPVLGPLTTSRLESAYVASLAAAPWNRVSSAVSTSAARTPRLETGSTGDAVRAMNEEPLRPLERLAALPHCWICQSAHQEEALVHDRCLCSEMTARVHVSCLTEWVLVRGHTHCPVCEARYRVRPATDLAQYRQGTPLVHMSDNNNKNNKSGDGGGGGSRSLRVHARPCASPGLSVPDFELDSGERRGSQAVPPLATTTAADTYSTFSPLRLLPQAPVPSLLTPQSPCQRHQAQRKRSDGDGAAAESLTGDCSSGSATHSKGASPSLHELAERHAQTTRSPPTSAPAPPGSQSLALSVRLPLSLYHATACTIALLRLAVQLLWWLCGDVVCVLGILLLLSGELPVLLRTAQAELPVAFTFSRVPPEGVCWQTTAVHVAMAGWRLVARDLPHALAAVAMAWWHSDALGDHGGAVLGLTVLVRVVRVVESRALASFDAMTVPVAVFTATRTQRSRHRSPPPREAQGPAVAAPDTLPACVARPLWSAMTDVESVYRLWWHWLRASSASLSRASRAGCVWWTWSPRCVLCVVLLQSARTRGRAEALMHAVLWLHEAYAAAAVVARAASERVASSAFVARSRGPLWLESILARCPLHVSKPTLTVLVVSCALGLTAVLVVALCSMVARRRRGRRCDDSTSREASKPPSMDDTPARALEWYLLLQVDNAPSPWSLAPMAAAEQPHHHTRSADSGPSHDLARPSLRPGRRRRHTLERQRRAQYGACRTVVVVRGAKYAFAQRELVRWLHVAVCPWLVGVCVQAVTRCVVDWSLPLWGGAAVVWGAPRVCTAPAPVPAPGPGQSLAVPLLWGLCAVVPSLDVLTVCGHWVAGAAVLWCVTQLIVGPALGSVVAPRVMQDWLGLIQAHPLDVAGVDACVSAHWVRGNGRRERWCDGGGGFARACAWTVDTVVYVVPRELCRVLCRTAVCCVLVGVPSCLLWCGRRGFTAVVPASAQYASTPRLPLWTLGPAHPHDRSSSSSSGASGLAAHTAALDDVAFDSVVLSVQRWLSGTTAVSRTTDPAVAYIVGCAVAIRAWLWSCVLMLETHRVLPFATAAAHPIVTTSPTTTASSPSSMTWQRRWWPTTRPASPVPAPPTELGLLARLLRRLRQWWGTASRAPPPPPPPPVRVPVPSPAPPRSPQSRLSFPSWSATRTRCRALRGPIKRLLSDPRPLARHVAQRLVTMHENYTVALYHRLRDVTPAQWQRLAACVALAIVGGLLARWLRRWARARWSRLVACCAAVWLPCAWSHRYIRTTPDGERNAAPWRLLDVVPLSFRGVLGTHPVASTRTASVPETLCDLPWWVSGPQERRSAAAMARHAQRSEEEVRRVVRRARQTQRRQLWHVVRLERQARESRRVQSAQAPASTTTDGTTPATATMSPPSTSPSTARHGPHGEAYSFGHRRRTARRTHWLSHRWCRAVANGWRRLRLLCFLLASLCWLSVVCFGPLVCVMTVLADVVPHALLLLTLATLICGEVHVRRCIMAALRVTGLLLSLCLQAVLCLCGGLWSGLWLPWRGDALALSLLPPRWVVAQYPSTLTSTFHSPQPWRHPRGGGDDDAVTVIESAH